LPSASRFGYESLSALIREQTLLSNTKTAARLIGMSGSLRSGSYSNAVLETLREKFAGRAEITNWDLRPIPPYDQDYEGEKRPEPVKALLAAIADSDGLVLCAPEFNHSIPGVLKNALDWASRPAFTSVMAYKPVAIMATSPGSQSGARCLD
jgi:chromate reductase, NAD(P)H dehydrogenase (quinone)